MTSREHPRGGLAAWHGAEGPRAGREAGSSLTLWPPAAYMKLMFSISNGGLQ